VDTTAHSQTRGSHTRTDTGLDPALTDALATLTSSGTLTAEQAASVRTAVTEASARSASAEPDAAKKRNPLPEILGYVGAALVLSALMSLIMQSWPDWSLALRATVLGIGAGVLITVAVVITLVNGGRARLRPPNEAVVIRRIVALVLALAVPLLGLLTEVLMMMGTPNEAGRLGSRLLAGGIALIAAIGAAWWVRGAMTTLAAAGASVWFVTALMIELGERWPDWTLPLIAAAGAAVWLALAPRLLAIPPLSEALGVAFLLTSLAPFALAAEDMDLGPEATATGWVARGLLIAFALLGLTLFGRGANWPWAAGGTIAGALAALAIGGETLGWITGSFAAGVVLLVLSGVLIFVRRRYMRSGAETPHSSSPFAST
jgi:hypothetical protein